VPLPPVTFVARPAARVLMCISNMVHRARIKYFVGRVLELYVSSPTAHR
jgi:hypothetical protein